MPPDTSSVLDRPTADSGELRQRVDRIAEKYRICHRREVDWRLQLLRGVVVYPFVRDLSGVKSLGRDERLLLDVLGYLRVGHSAGEDRPLEDDYLVVSRLVEHVGLMRLRSCCRVADDAYRERFGDRPPSAAFYESIVDQQMLDSVCEGVLQSETLDESLRECVQCFRRGYSLERISEVTRVEPLDAIVDVVLAMWAQLVDFPEYAPEG